MRTLIKKNYTEYKKKHINTKRMMLVSNFVQCNRLKNCQD